MKKYVLTALSVLALTGTMSGAEGYTNFNYGSNNPGNQSLWGTAKQESYDIAMRITDPAMVGKTISEIKVPVVECEGISNYSIWLSNELTVENKLNVADIASYPCAASDGFISVTLDTPFEIPAEGVYVGYSFVMSSLGTEEKKPVVITEYTYFTESFFIHTNRSYKSWTNLSGSLYDSPVINVVVNGDFPENSLDVVSVSELNIAESEDSSIAFTVRNSGGNPISALSYAILIDGQKAGEGVLDFASPIEPSVFDTSLLEVPLSWNVIPNPTIGNHSLEVEVTGVNAMENTSANYAYEGNLNILSFIPVHKPIIEEYTGLWCSYCPRGYVGLEIMSHLYPDDFIGISYHYGDEMEVIPSSDYPNEIDGYPDAWIDRVAHTDAYSGYASSDEFGVDKVWESCRRQLAPADIAITAKFTDSEQTAIEIDAQTTFAKKNDGDTYRQVFMLLGNGMTKETWIQTNNYAGDTEFLDTPYAEYWEQFVNSNGGVRGVIYNDILLAYTDIKGEGHDLPVDLTVNTPLPMSHTFTLSEVVNVKGKEIVQDKDQLYAVVLLLNGETGAVENANKVKVEGYSAINSAEASAEPVETSYYDLTGRKIAKPEGISISRTVYSDGTVKTDKIITTKY